MPAREGISLTRHELLDLVWSKPMTQLARELGLSDNGLRKVCRRHQVPRPPAGYFLAHEHRRPAKPVLPECSEARLETIRIDSPLPEPAMSIPAALQVEIEAEMRADYPIVVASKLTRPHPLIAAARDYLGKREPLGHGPPSLPPRAGELNVRVTRGSLQRALRIMDALVKAAELRGHKVVVEGHDNKVVTVIEAHGEEIAIKLTEKTTQHKTVPAPDESRAKHPWESARRYSFAPSGRLTLEIDEYSRERITKRWQDGPRCQLEDCLNEFFVSVLRFAAVKRNERATRERERLDEERRRQQREQRQRLIAEEQKRLDGLLQDVEAWHLARRIRTYLKAIDESSDEVTDDWIRWAADQADRIDPSVPSPKSILDEVEPPRETSDLLSLLMDGLGWEETPPKNFWARRPWRTR